MLLAKGGRHGEAAPRVVRATALRAAAARRRNPFAGWRWFRRNRRRGAGTTRNVCGELSRFGARIAQGGRLHGMGFFSFCAKFLLNINIPLRFASSMESADHGRKYAAGFLEVRPFKLYAKQV
jgi:hypothetical protein